jgi:hypothetical protein
MDDNVPAFVELPQLGVTLLPRNKTSRDGLGFRYSRPESL